MEARYERHGELPEEALVRELSAEAQELLGHIDTPAEPLATTRTPPKVHYTVWLHSKEPLKEHHYANDRVCGAQEMEPGGLSAHFTGFAAHIAYVMIWGGDEIPLHLTPLSPTVNMLNCDHLQLTFDEITDNNGLIRRNVFD